MVAEVAVAVAECSEHGNPWGEPTEDPAPE